MVNLSHTSVLSSGCFTSVTSEKKYQLHLFLLDETIYHPQFKLVFIYLSPLGMRKPCLTIISMTNTIQYMYISLLLVEPIVWCFQNHHTAMLCKEIFDPGFFGRGNLRKIDTLFQHLV